MSAPALALPWTDRSGRIAPLKAAVFGLLFVPAGLLLWPLLVGPPVARPVTGLIHGTGDWTVILLLTSLAITPLRHILNWPKLISVRRMVGVSAFGYALAHFLLYILDQNGNLLKVGSEIVLRFYLTIGFFGLLILTALAITSTDGMIRRLGAPWWQALHRGAYLAAALALTHYFLQSKDAVSGPILATGVAVFLLAYRLVLWTKGARIAAHPLTLAGLGLAVVVAVGLGETAYLAMGYGAPFGAVLAAQFDLGGYEIRPAVWLAAMALPLPLLALLRRRRPAGSGFHGIS